MGPGSDPDRCLESSATAGRRHLLQPQWCQFRQPRALPSDIRWVPTAWLDDQQCYFVPRSPPGTACVVQCHSSGLDRHTCIHLPIPLDQAGTPGGWRLRADIQSRSPEPCVRDGDVLVPAEHYARRRVHSFSRRLLVSASVVLHRRSAALTLLVLSLVGTEAFAMQEPVRGPNFPAKVGLFPWRLPEHLRTCADFAEAGQPAALLTPYSDTSRVCHRPAQGYGRRSTRPASE